MVSSSVLSCTLVVALFVLTVSSIKVELIRDEYERLGTKANLYDEEYQNGEFRKLNRYNFVRFLYNFPYFQECQLMPNPKMELVKIFFADGKQGN